MKAKWDNFEDTIMTIKEIDERIAKVRSEMGKYNFCTTFEHIEISNLQKAKELILKAQAMSKEELVNQFVELSFRERKHRTLVASITRQRNNAYTQLGQESELIDIDKMLKEDFPVSYD